MRSNDEIMDILDQRRNELNLSISEVARRMDMAKSAISRYFNRSREFPLNRIDDICSVLGLDTKEVLGFGDQIEEFESVGSAELDYFGSVTAGAFEDSYTTVDKITVPNNILKEELDHYFVLKANGDSMNKVISNAHYIVVLDFRKTSNTFYKTNDIVIVRNGTEYTMKRIRKTDTMVHFEPDSYIDEFKTQSFAIDDFNELLIVGKVIYSFRIFS